MTDKERKYFVGMVSGWITVAAVSLYAFVWNYCPPEETPSGTSSIDTAPKPESPTPTPTATRITTNQPLETRRVSSQSESSTDPEETPEPLYVSQDEVADFGDEEVNPLLAIAPTHDEMAAFMEVRDEYNQRLQEATENLKGDELRKAVEEISEEFLPRFESVLGKDRLEVLAEQTRKAIISGGLADRVPESERAIANEMTGNQPRSLAP